MVDKTALKDIITSAAHKRTQWRAERPFGCQDAAAHCDKLMTIVSYTPQAVPQAWPRRMELARKLRDAILRGRAR